MFWFKKGIYSRMKRPFLMRILSFFLVFTGFWLLFTLTLNQQRPVLEDTHAKLSHTQVSSADDFAFLGEMLA